jgi:hypothetical protein
MLKRFFIGGETVDRLAEDLSDAAIRIDQVHSTIQIADMDGVFALTSDHMVLLCDATLSKALTAEALSTIAFALLASDHFEWNDEAISEVLQDWSCPEINFPWSTAY